jgi:hypothetical protein
MPHSQPPEPWHSFLKELDAQLVTEVQLHCLGGFAITMRYGLRRQTADVDFLSAVPFDEMQRILELGGQGSPLQEKYKVYLQRVTEANPPESYEDRLIEMFPSLYQKLRLFALDPYDLALSKLERNIERDRDDVKYLAGPRTAGFDQAEAEIRRGNAALPIE